MSEVCWPQKIVEENIMTQPYKILNPVTVDSGAAWGERSKESGLSSVLPLITISC